jgi:hypothetical protein
MRCVESKPLAVCAMRDDIAVNRRFDCRAAALAGFSQTSAGTSDVR